MLTKPTRPLMPYPRSRRPPSFQFAPCHSHMCPQLGIKISTHFIIAHLRLTLLGHPLPCLSHLILDLLLTLAVIHPTVVAAIVDVHPTVVAASIVIAPHCNTVLVIKLLIVECK